MIITHTELARISKLNLYAISATDPYQAKLMSLDLQNLNDSFVVFNVEPPIRKSIEEGLNHLPDVMKYDITCYNTSVQAP